MTQEQKERISETLKQYYIQGGQKNNCSKTYVYDIEGNFINEFETRTQAAEFAGTDKKKKKKNNCLNVLEQINGRENKLMDLDFLMKNLIVCPHYK